MDDWRIKVEVTLEPNTPIAVDISASMTFVTLDEMSQFSAVLQTIAAGMGPKAPGK